MFDTYAKDSLGRAVFLYHISPPLGCSQLADKLVDIVDIILGENTNPIVISLHDAKIEIGETIKFMPPHKELGMEGEPEESYILQVISCFKCLIAWR